MADHSRIEWTDATWNPVTGCTKVSQGCKHCYAARMATRLQAMGVPRYAHGFAVTLHPDLLDLPRHWVRPRRVFVNSMSDLFHSQVPDDYILRVFAVMAALPQHTFQVLTKRPERARALAPQLPWPSNVWCGTSVENDAVIARVDLLRDVPAAVRFLSCEPLLGPLTRLDLLGIHWVIAGGESGPGHRPMEADWARHLRDLCQQEDVPFFFKQWGGATPKSGGRVLDGRTWNGAPPHVAEASVV